MSQIEGSQNTEEPVEEDMYPRAAPIMVAITLLLFLGMISLLGYRWLNMAEPNGFVLIQGSKEFDGAEATVSDSAGDAESHGVLKESNEYTMRFPLPQGMYKVLITQNDKVIVKESVALREGTGMVINLDQNPTTEPAAQ
jgi:hypothetical protein